MAYPSIPTGGDATRYANLNGKCFEWKTTATYGGGAWVVVECTTEEVLSCDWVFEELGSSGSCKDALSCADLQFTEGDCGDSSLTVARSYIAAGTGLGCFSCSVANSIFVDNSFLCSQIGCSNVENYCTDINTYVENEANSITCLLCEDIKIIKDDRTIACADVSSTCIEDTCSDMIGSMDTLNCTPNDTECADIGCPMYCDDNADADSYIDTNNCSIISSMANTDYNVTQIVLHSNVTGLFNTMCYKTHDSLTYTCVSTSSLTNNGTYNSDRKAIFYMDVALYSSEKLVGAGSYYINYQYPNGDTEYCTSDAECASGRCDDYDGVCRASDYLYPTIPVHACTLNSQCESNYCNGGTCQEEITCAAIGETCAVVGDCCEGTEVFCSYLDGAGLECVECQDCVDYWLGQEYCTAGEIGDYRCGTNVRCTKEGSIYLWKLIGTCR